MRVRVTRHEPLTGSYIGLTLWWGSMRRGWNGVSVLHPHMRWKITSEPPIS